jgi:hypothetical protein
MFVVSCLLAVVESRRLYSAFYVSSPQKVMNYLSFSNGQQATGNVQRIRWRQKNDPVMKNNQKILVNVTRKLTTLSCFQEVRRSVGLAVCGVQHNPCQPGKIRQARKILPKFQQTTYYLQLTTRTGYRTWNQYLDSKQF